MSLRTYALKEAERMVPLLRSIGREIKSRLKATEAIQKRIEGLSRSPRKNELEIFNLEAELSVQRREIRCSEKELERLGCSLDADHPLRILIPSPAGHWTFEGPLDDTRFHPAPGSRAP